MRIVTRPDFDGIVCAVLLKDIFNIINSIKWIEPSDIKFKKVTIYDTDIIANLPYNNKCYLWFDHHFSNKPEGFFKGSFELAPSAARVIYQYYEGQFSKNFDRLIFEVDKIDSADLSLDEILQPEAYKYLLLSMTISGRNIEDEPYWNYLVENLSLYSIKDLMNKENVLIKANKLIKNNILYKEKLILNTYCIGNVSVTDFRSVVAIVNGNRFLVHSLFSECTVNIKISFQESIAIISASKNILKKGCNVNLGEMFKKFGGGGHNGAGACSFAKELGDEYLNKIISILLKN